MSPQEANELEIFRRLKWEYDYRKENAELRAEMERLGRENAALREAGHLAEKIIVQRTDEIRHLERENAALRAYALEMASAMRITRDSGSACGEALARAECAELRLNIAKLRATIDAATT